MSGHWITLFALAWLGMWLAQLTPFQLLLPTQLNEVLGVGSQLHHNNWQRSVLGFGAVSGLSAVCALIAFPVAGALSDRTTGRFGRRRPWILIGTVVFAGSLVVLGRQHNLAGIAFWWCATVTGFCVAASALTAMIGDQVPQAQRGTVSGAIAAPQAIGLIAGIALVTVFSLGSAAGYVVVGAVLLACVVPFVWRTPDPVIDTGPRHNESVWQLLRLRDFRWVLTGRVLVNLGNTLGTSLLLFYLQFELKITDPGRSLLVLTGTYMVLITIVSLGCGWMSDRLGRRKPFVLAAGILQSVASMILIGAENLCGAVISSAVLGAGYGCFLAVDQALAADVLPSAEHSGKDLGIMNIALAVPQAIGPLIGATIVRVWSGFSELFIIAAVFTALGGVTVLRVRNVR